MGVRNLGRLYGLASAVSALFLAGTFAEVANATDAHRSARSRELAKKSQKHFTSPEHTKKPSESIWQHVRDQPYLTGDWGGARTTLAEHGITLDVTFMMNLATNPVGGLGWGFNQANNTGASLGIDFHALADIPGLFFYTSFSFRQGQNLALRRFPAQPTDQGGPFPIKFQQIWGGQTYHLVNLYVQQTLSLFQKDDLSLRVGRLAHFDSFARDIAWSYYENNAFDGNPFGFFEQGPGSFYVYPFATWGAVLSFGTKFSESEGMWARVGLYGADTELSSADSHGTRFSFDFNRGANIMMETGYKRNWLVTNTGLPGKYSVGGWIITGDFPRWDGGVQPGIGGVYYVVSQGLFVEDEQSHVVPGGIATMEEYWGTPDKRIQELQGWFFWSTGEFSASSQTSAMDRWVEFGTYYRGAIPGRDTDIIALALYYGWFSGPLKAEQRALGAAPQTYEAGLELGYRFYPIDSVYLQPNVMGIINPGGAGQYGDAWIIGAQTAMDL